MRVPPRKDVEWTRNFFPFGEQSCIQLRARCAQSLRAEKVFPLLPSLHAKARPLSTKLLTMWSLIEATARNKFCILASPFGLDYFCHSSAAKLEEAERRREFQGDLRKNVVTNWSFKMVKGRGKGMVLQVSKSESNETAQSTEDAWEDSSTSDAENATVSMAARRLRGEARAPHKVSSVPKVCGSPATNQYADVDTQCLYDSPTAHMWRASHAKVGQARHRLLSA